MTIVTAGKHQHMHVSHLELGQHGVAGTTARGRSVGGIGGSTCGFAVKDRGLASDNVD